MSLRHSPHQSGLETRSGFSARPFEVTAHPGQDQPAQKCPGGFENSSTQREQVRVEVGVMEMGQDGDTQNFKFQSQTNGILGLQHTVTEPPTVPGAGGGGAMSPLTRALLVVPDAHTPTTY